MSILTSVPHPWEGARTIDLLDYLATRLVDERDQYNIAQGQFRSEEIRARRHEGTPPMTDQADMEARAQAVIVDLILRDSPHLRTDGVRYMVKSDMGQAALSPSRAVAAMLAFEAERGAEREAAAYARAAEVARGEKVDADATDDESDRAYNRACDHIASAILALGEAKG